MKKLDPAHPTFTAIAGIDPIKAAAMDTHVPHLDFVGINTYGGVFSLRQQLAKMGWKRPWMLTEWGPQGFWERPKTSFGAPLEQTSSGKAAMLRSAYKAAIFPDGGCLGSYVFLWGWKFEATVTWFGLLSHEDHTTASVDALQEMWTGTKSANQAPAIENLLGVPKSPLPAGGTFDARVDATDPDGDALIFHWDVLPEQQKQVPGKRLPMPAPVGKPLMTLWPIMCPSRFLKNRESTVCMSGSRTVKVTRPPPMPPLKSVEARSLSVFSRLIS